jgi:hypothetical protein
LPNTEGCVLKESIREFAGFAGDGGRMGPASGERFCDAEKNADSNALALPMTGSATGILGSTAAASAALVLLVFSATGAVEGGAKSKTGRPPHAPLQAGSTQGSSGDFNVSFSPKVMQLSPKLIVLASSAEGLSLPDVC